MKQDICLHRELKGTRLWASTVAVLICTHHFKIRQLLSLLEKSKYNSLELPINLKPSLWTVRGSHCVRIQTSTGTTCKLYTDKPTQRSRHSWHQAPGTEKSQESPGFESTSWLAPFCVENSWSPCAACVVSRYSSFVSHTKHIHVRLTGDSKLTVSVNISVNGCLCKCRSPGDLTRGKLTSHSDCTIDLWVFSLSPPPPLWLSSLLVYMCSLVITFKSVFSVFENRLKNSVQGNRF